jgi:hypothetical protein
MSFKDKITSHLPGHKTQDKNANGIPDRMEKGTAASGTRNLGQNAAMLPGTQYSSTTTTTTAMPLGQSGFTDLNRDGIPDQFQQGYQQSFTGAPIVDVVEAPTLIEKFEKPAVVHEVIRTEEVVEVQPVIEREREKLDVYEVVQPIREREVVATEVRSAVLPAQTRAAIVEDQSAFLSQRSAPGEFSTREVAPTMHQTIQNAPIVHETITHKVIEEVQPVIYKEIDRPVLIKETLPIYEKVVEAPQAHHSVLPMRDLGTSFAQSSTTFVGTDFNRNGIPDQLEGGMAYQTGYTDLNRNGIPDSLETGFQSGLAQPGFAMVNVPTEAVREVVTTHVTTTTGDRIGRDHNNLSSGTALPATSTATTGKHGLFHRNKNTAATNTGKHGLFHRNKNATTAPSTTTTTTTTTTGVKDLNGNGIDDSLERSMANTTLNSQTY